MRQVPIVAFCEWGREMGGGGGARLTNKKNKNKACLTHE